jgi:hypothetical protein
MPSAPARAAPPLGFSPIPLVGNHERWNRPSPFKIVRQLGISIEELGKLRSATDESRFDNIV